MDNKITDPEILKQLEEEARFIEQLMDLENDSIVEETLKEIDDEETDYSNDPIVDSLSSEVDLVINRQGEYIHYKDSLVLIEHRNYYVEEEECYWLEFQGIDEDIDRYIKVIDSEGDTVEVSDDYQGLVHIGEFSYLNSNSAIKNGYINTSGIWKKPEIPTNNIDTSALLFYKDMENSLNQFYPNNWWFQEIKYTFDHNIVERQDSLPYIRNYKYVLVVKFPYIEITNSRKQKHIIEDLYVVLPINELGNSSSAIYGFRGKITSIEYNNNYYHSHLPNSSELHIGLFCLGSGPLIQILGNMYSKPFNKDLFTYFLANLKVYVDWESIEGTPHRRIENILNKRLIDVTETSVYNQYNKYLDNNIDKLNLNIEYDTNNKLLDVNFKKLEQSLFETLINHLGLNIETCYRDEELNQYFHLSNSNTNRFPNYLKIPLCKLDDKDIFLEYKTVENRETEFKKVIHPNITHYAKKYLTRRVNEYYFKENKNRLSRNTNS